MSDKVYVNFPGRIIMVGFGSIGQGVLPLILRHIAVAPERIVIVTADESGSAEAERWACVSYASRCSARITRRVLDGPHGPRRFSGESVGGCFEHCAGQALLGTRGHVPRHLHRALGGGYTDPTLSPGRRTNYALRDDALQLRTDLTAKHPTAILTHGANPGLVSHFVKEALLTLKRDIGVDKEKSDPVTRTEWAELAQALGIRVMHVAERDTQLTNQPKQVNEFVNTWSVDGFVSEGCQPAELGWGTHERNFPRDAKRHDLVPARRSTWVSPEPPRGCAHGRRRPAHPRFPDHAQRAISLADYYTCASTATCCIGRPRTTPTTPAILRCCQCTSWPVATGRCRTASAS
jgi:homospermidine synthase